MRATRHPTVRPDAEGAPARRDVIIRPAPIAMVWQGPGQPHAAIAVPGVSLGDGDVLVAVELATICPSDVAAVLDGAGVTAPLVLGHEQVGRVVALGSAAATSDGSRLVVGMRVVWSRRIGCGECPSCRDGLTAECRDAREYGADRLRRGWELSGGFASHVLVRAGTSILTVPEIVPAAVLAPLPCATALAAASVERVVTALDVGGCTVVVCGADLVGLTVTAMLADEGANVVVIEADATRRSRALDFGARGVAAAWADAARLIRSADAAPGEGPGVAQRLDRPVAVLGCGVLDADADADAAVAVGEELESEEPESGESGSAEPGSGRDRASIGWRADGPFGAVEVVVAIRDAPTPHGAGAGTGAEVEIDSDAASHRPATPRFTTVRRTEPHHLQTAVDFASNAWFRYPFAGLVSERFPLERLDEAIGSAAGASSLRIAIDPNGR